MAFLGSTSSVRAQIIIGGGGVEYDVGRFSISLRIKFLSLVILWIWIYGIKWTQDIQGSICILINPWGCYTLIKLLAVMNNQQIQML